ncbi:MAG: MBL fold metallo-hydrolase [Prolixibacteraceae bacterium]|nr:MBL fold metallo-hydrolase [Prolixibacteraceae bacterium]
MMRSFFIALLFICTFSIATARNTNVKQITPDVITISPDRKQLQTLGWPNDIINSVAINTGNGIILIDTQNSPANARLIKSEIIDQFNDSTFVYIINTHGHSCHTGGNSVFDQQSIVAHSLSIDEIKNYDDIFLGQTIDFLRKKIYYNNNVLDTMRIENAISDSINESIDLYRFYEDDLLNNYKVRYPDLTFDDTLTISHGNKTIKLMYMGKGHGNADIMAYIEQDKVLCTGNLFHLGAQQVEAMPSFYLNRVNEIDKWVATMNTFLKQYAGDFTILTTHGKKNFDRENLEFINAYCQLVSTEVKAAKNSGISLEKLLENESFDNFFKKNRNIIGSSSKIAEMHERNLRIIWKYL